MTDTPTPTQEQQQAPQLTINDLVAARDTIKVTLERGGLFKVDEMQVLMTVYKKLNDFIEYAEAVTKANEAKAAAEKEAADKAVMTESSDTAKAQSTEGV